MKKAILFFAGLSLCFIGVACHNSNNSKDGSEDSINKDSMVESTSEDEAQTPLVTPDLAFFELKGPVKKVTVDKILTIEFDQNGNMTKHSGEFSFKRDKQGRIAQMEGYENYITYKWNGDKLVGTESAAEGSMMEEVYTYDERGFVVKIKHTVDGDVEYETLTYSNLDNYGNWTKRTSKGYEYGRGSATRIIEYYSEQTSETSDAPKGYDMVYEMAITGHPNYTKAILYSQGWDEEGAFVCFYDRQGKMVKSYQGYGSFSAQGFLADFDDNQIEIGVMGMGAGPIFSAYGKGYKVKVVREQ
ncbi:MAG: hypothetical protein J6Y98_00165 [Bacteroidales bacterium]|nr:hypothetical protein [Bacteroidales bacterium]